MPGFVSEYGEGYRFLCGRGKAKFVGEPET